MTRSAPLAVILVLALPSSAHAYIDPGSGYMITQLIVAAVAGSLFYFRSLLRFFGRLFGIRKNPAPENGSGSTAETTDAKQKRSA